MGCIFLKISSIKTTKIKWDRVPSFSQILPHRCHLFLSQGMAQLLKNINNYHTRIEREEIRTKTRLIKINRTFTINPTCMKIWEIVTWQILLRETQLCNLLAQINIMSRKFLIAWRFTRTLNGCLNHFHLKILIFHLLSKIKTSLSSIRINLTFLIANPWNGKHLSITHIIIKWIQMVVSNTTLVVISKERCN